MKPITDNLAVVTSGEFPDAEITALIAEIDALHAKATPAPWKHVPQDNYICGPRYELVIDIQARSSLSVSMLRRDANAALVTALRNAWPKLRARIAE